MLAGFAIVRSTKVYRNFKNLIKFTILQNFGGVGLTSLRCLSSKKEETFKTRPYKLYKRKWISVNQWSPIFVLVDYGPNDETVISRDEALTYYRQMQVIRRLETTAGNLYKEKKIR